METILFPGKIRLRVGSKLKEVMGLRTHKACWDFPKTQRIDTMGTTRNSQEKNRTAPTKEVIPSEEKQILKQVNEYD